MKRDSVSAYVKMRRDTPFPYTQLYAFWMIPPNPPHQLCTHSIDGPFLNKKTNTFQYEQNNKKHCKVLVAFEYSIY